MPSMGFAGGLENGYIKRKYRWMLEIDGVAGTGENTANALPPSKAARPSLTYKEFEVQHLNETVYFPSKPDWKPINITLYEPNCGPPNEVWDWLSRCYNARSGSWTAPCEVVDEKSFKMPQVVLRLLDGKGDTVEEWVYENAYPSTIEFGDLEMGNSEVVTCDITLRYDRAYVR